jgi:uncharacterized membrane protein
LDANSLQTVSVLNAIQHAYYFSFASMAWFFSPIALVFATALVVLILYGRKFKSDALEDLKDKT